MIRGDDDYDYTEENTLNPTPVLPPGAITSTLPPGFTLGSKGQMPADKFLVRTVLHSNITILHNKVEDFKQQLERKLTRAYRYINS